MSKWIPLTDVRLVRLRTGVIRARSPDCTPRVIEVHDCDDCPYQLNKHCTADDYRPIDYDNWWYHCPLYRGPIVTVLNSGEEE